MEDSTVTGKNLRLDGKIITINEGEIKGYLNTVVKDVVEETLNGMLDAEADELCKASSPVLIRSRHQLAGKQHIYCVHGLFLLDKFGRG